jgi:hypothetical protein
MHPFALYHHSAPPPSNAVAVTVAVASLHCAAPRLCLGAMSSISHPPSAILIPLTPAHPRPNYALSPTVVSAPVRPHPSASRGIVQQRGSNGRSSSLRLRFAVVCALPPVCTPRLCAFTMAQLMTTSGGRGILCAPGTSALTSGGPDGRASSEPAPCPPPPPSALPDPEALPWCDAPHRCPPSSSSSSGPFPGRPLSRRTRTVSWPISPLLSSRTNGPTPAFSCGQ